ncbi:N-methylhydantoinase A [Burkholderia sp. GAS332]|nr:N-methylhydantoinase A [Burkholderia sp. GAS332]
MSKDAKMSKDFWIGIDTGGTFTDLVLQQPSTGRRVYHKVPTKTADPAQGILDGIAELLNLADVSPTSVAFLVLGTTLATNAVLEGTWARTGMITTRGFKDVLDIARQRRPHFFDLDIPKPVPPSVRGDRVEVAGRIGANGSEIAPLNNGDVERAIHQLKASGVQSVAICFMHSYANGCHEKRALETVKKLWPEVYVCTSSGVLPEFREYERFVTAVVNASLLPVMDAYIERFASGVRQLGIPCEARVMQSNGGAVTTGTVRRMPVNTFFSGPAGGVMATVALGRQTGIGNLIAFDMGGTSTDVCLVKDFEPSFKNERAMAGLPVRTRTLDIHTIGAGGGSIASLDAGGMLKVGPKSASAYPGPAAYGRGGVLPTVTDANVLLGRLNPVSLLDGRMAVYADRAQAAVQKEIAGPAEMSEVEAAAGILEIATVHMTGAVRVISVERGEDPRDYALVAFGGAGPLHAAEVAMAAGMDRVLVPPRPGLLSAQGLLQSDQRGDFSLTRLVLLEPAQLPSINAGLVEIDGMVEEWLAQEKSAGENTSVDIQLQADLRYAGQNSEMTAVVADRELDEADLFALENTFHSMHERRYGYAMADQAVELVSLRGTVVLRRDKGAGESLKVSCAVRDAIVSTRSVWYQSTGVLDTPVYKRELLASGSVFSGPAIVEQMDTTTVVPPAASVRVDEFGNLHIDLSQAIPVASSTEVSK